MTLAILSGGRAHAACEIDPAHFSEPLIESGIVTRNSFFLQQCERAHGALLDVTDPSLTGHLQRPSGITVKGHRDYYPTAAKRTGAQGRSDLAIIVEPDGSISAIVVVGSSGYKMLDDAAVELYRDSSFTLPAMLDGVPVRVLMYTHTNFGLT